MKLMSLSAVLGAALLVAPGCMAEDETVSSGSQEMEMDGDGGHGGGHHCPGPSPVMQVGDFDGDGVVGGPDVDMLSAHVEAGDYAAFFDMNVDGVLDGKDVSIVARNIGEAGTARDAQMAALWATVEPYRNINNAFAAGYVPFTPDLKGHGIHFANFDLIYSYADRGGFNADQPEGLNYTAQGELVAAFFYGLGAIDLYDYGYAPVPDTYFQQFPPPHPTFDGLMPHAWHQHIGPCFGGATQPILGFDQCMTEQACYDVGGQLWSPQFHMLHVWLIELNECGPFGGIDEDISVNAPEEPHHGDCTLADVVPVVVNP
jgi:hypothetical protein